MAKKNARRAGGGAGIKVVDDELEVATDELRHEANGGHADSSAYTAKPKRNVKSKVAQNSDRNFAVSDIKKAAAFANSVGGLDKAIAVLQILKVAKDVQ